MPVTPRVRGEAECFLAGECVYYGKTFLHALRRTQGIPNDNMDKEEEKDTFLHNRCFPLHTLSHFR